MHMLHQQFVARSLLRIEQVNVLSNAKVVSPRNTGLLKSENTNFALFLSFSPHCLWLEIQLLVLDRLE